MELLQLLVLFFVVVATTGEPGLELITLNAMKMSTVPNTRYFPTCIGDTQPTTYVASTM
jgi:hypothetical protein